MEQERDYLADAARYSLAMAQQNKEHVRLKIPCVTTSASAKDIELIQIIQDVNKSYIGYFNYQQKVADGYVIFYKELSVWIANSLVNRYISVAEAPYILNSFEYDGEKEILYIYMRYIEEEDIEEDETHLNKNLDN